MIFDIIVLTKLKSKKNLHYVENISTFRELNNHKNKIIKNTKCQ